MVDDQELDVSPDAVQEPESDAPAQDHEASEDPSSESVAGRLVVKRGGVETSDVFLFGDSAVIGRFDPAVGPIDVDLGSLPEGAYVSRKHSKISYADGGWRIQDLGSSNGTFVLRDDFERVEESELLDGDEIALGNARFVFHTAN